MRTILLCLVLAACAVPTQVARNEDPRFPRRDTGDVIVNVPHNRDDRVERQDAAARCAGYGRIEVRRRNGEYECVSPDQYSRENDDTRR